MMIVPSLLALVVATVISSSIDGVYDYKPKRNPVGTVFFYEKSNIDGTHASNVALYVAADDKLESLKWTSGSHQSTLVKAVIDWTTFSVKRFDSVRLDDEGNEQTVAVLEASDDGTVLDIQFGGQTMNTVVQHLPWHSYDFDFASLGFAMRHLKNPKKNFEFGICDVVRLPEGPSFAFKGMVQAEYAGDEKREGRKCRTYTIDGDGLENRGGLLWIDAKTRDLVDFEIDLPDEPGYESGKLRLVETHKFTAEEWANFKTTRN